MGEEHGLVEALLADRNAGGIDGDARERGEAFEDARLEGQRHQGRAGLGDLQAEQGGKLIGQAGGAHLGDRLAAGGDDQRFSDQRLARRHHGEAAIGVADAVDPGVEQQGAARLFQLAEQQVDDLLARAVAEQLAQSLFVERDGVLIDQRDEMLRRVAGEGREGIARVAGEEAVAAGFHRGVDVGEVAAPAAGDADLLAGVLGMVEHQHRAAALAGFDAGHEAGGAGAEDDHVIMLHGVGMAVFRGRCKGEPVAAAKLDVIPAKAGIQLAAGTSG